jgi:hypothetical protein
MTNDFEGQMTDVPRDEQNEDENKESEDEDGEELDREMADLGDEGDVSGYYLISCRRVPFYFFYFFFLHCLLVFRILLMVIWMGIAIGGLCVGCGREALE